MNRELLSAIEERIKDGYSEASVTEEMVAVGYTEAEARDAYAAASRSLPRPASTVRTPLPSLGDFMGEVWQVSYAGAGLFGKAVLMAVAACVAVMFGILILSEIFSLGTRESLALTGFYVPLFAMFVGSVIVFALTRALLFRAQVVRFKDHVWYVLRHFIPLMLITFYITVLTQVGYAFFIIPGLMAAIYFSLAVPIALVRDTRGFRALTESIALVHGRFFAVAGRIIVVNVVMVVAAAALVMIAAALSAGFVGNNSLLDLASAPLLISLVIVAVMACVYWLTCGLVVLYESLERVPSPAVLSERTLSAARVSFIVIVLLTIVMMVAAAFVLLDIISWIIEESRSWTPR